MASIEKEIKKEEKKLESSINKFTKKLKQNPWIFVSIVLAIVLIIVTIIAMPISKAKAGDKLVTFLNERVGGGVTLINVSSQGAIYEVFVSYKGQEIPVYITKDGSYFIQAAEKIVKATTNNNQPSPTEVPKSDKPVVELYVFTYCPYGTQSEKGIIPVVKLLGDKIDFKIRQIGAMHGEFEKIEAQRQLCIEKLYPTKLLDYILAFDLNSEVGACNGDATCVGPKIDALYAKLGIVKSKIDSCMPTEGATLYAAEETNAQAKGVSGSPTLIINGVDAQSGRDSASYLATICSAFNTAPAECSQTLSSSTPSPGFGSSSSGDSAAAASCG